MRGLDYEEGREYATLSNNLSVYIADIDRQRKELKDAKVKKDEIEDKVDHSLRPSDNDFFRQDELWWKSYGPIELYK